MLASGLIKKLMAATSPTADGSNATLRIGPYGELFTADMLDDGDSSALSGCRYQMLPTPAAGGSGTALGIQTAFSDTANVAFLLVNGAAGGGKRVIMEYIKFRVTAAGTTTTSVEAAIEIDSTNRYSSTGTDMTGNIKSCTTEDNTASIVTPFRIGAVTAAAAGANRKFLWHELIRAATAPVWIVNDTVTFRFGNFDGMPNTVNVISGTDAKGTHYQWPVPPAVIGPGGSLLLRFAHVANASTAPSFEWEAGWKEY